MKVIINAPAVFHKKHGYHLVVDSKKAGYSSYEACLGTSTARIYENSTQTGDKETK